MFQLLLDFMNSHADASFIDSDKISAPQLCKTRHAKLEEPLAYEL